jgi:amidohydrolase
MRLSPVVFLLFAVVGAVPATAATLHADIQQRAAQVEPKVIAWRHDIHQHPELGNRETRTAALVAEQLRALKFDEVRTGVAHTGVVGVLKGALPGPVVALRADMDALPVTEPVGLPYASTVRTEFGGQQVGVMHACGHDAHTAILMGVAEVLAGMRAKLRGTVVFLFQPAEEGSPPGEEGGALLMVKEGVLQQPPVEAIFGLHVMPRASGELAYRRGGAMAGARMFRIQVKGKQTHGAIPWAGKDPVVTASQIITALQFIPSRQVDLTKGPALISVGSVHGGTRSNIIPDEVVLEGTIRSLDPAQMVDMAQRLERTASSIAAASGLTAEVQVYGGAPVTFNAPALVDRMLPSLQRPEVGAQAVKEAVPGLVAEDFAVFQEKVPGFFFFLGVNPPGLSDEDAAPNHSPLFKVDDAALKVGVAALATVAVDYLGGKK